MGSKFIFLFVLLGACKYAGNESVSQERSSPRPHSSSSHGDASHSSSGADDAGLPTTNDTGFLSRKVPLGGGGGKAAEVARVAKAMVGKENCTLFPPNKLKCAQQASDILRTAGVNIKGSLSVNALVSQLRKAGWRDGACGPGAVRHTAGQSHRHIGVIGTDNVTVHNSAKLGSSPRCGKLGTLPYDSWKKRTKCLVSPESV